MLRAADICLEDGVTIETGPHKHAIQQTFFLYVFEPGGNRVEVANAGARLILAPDWKPIVWSEEERKKGQAWGLKTIESFTCAGRRPSTSDTDFALEESATNFEGISHLRRGKVFSLTVTAKSARIDTRSVLLAVVIFC